MPPLRIPRRRIDFSGIRVDPMVRLDYFLHQIMSDDRDSQLESTISIRDIVNEHNHLEEMIRRPNVVSRFVQFLANDDFPQLKHEAAWLLADMTMSDIQVLVDCGTVPLFVKLINADVEEDRLLAVWALGNIADKSIERRDNVLSCGALMTLLSQCEVPNQTTTMLRAATDTLITLCSLSPCPPLTQIKPALRVLERFLQSKNSDLLFLSSCLLGLFFERGDNNETREALMNLGVIPRLMKLFEHERADIHEEVIRTICAVLRCENRVHSQVVIDQIPIPSIASYLNKAEDTLTKSIASYIVYRIASWDQNQLEAVIASGVVQNIIRLLQDHEPHLKCCLATIYTVASKRNHEHISLLVSQGCIEALCGTLTSPEKSIIILALNALEVILEVGQDDKENLVNPGRGGGSPYAKKILDAGGLEKLNALKASQDEHIKDEAIYIVAHYFNED